MKKVFVVLFTVFIYNFSLAQQSDEIRKSWDWLIGDWSGVGSGQPGEASGGFSFKMDLDNKIIVRTNITEISPQEGREAFAHKDLLVVYSSPGNSYDRAIYFDNEDHVINYTLNYQDRVITFTSDKIQNMPVFRLKYSQIDSDHINVLFEISMDGENFRKYLEGRSIKKK